MTAYTAIRRVVTGHDAGTDAPIIDGDAANVSQKASGIVSTLLWSTDDCPVSMPAGRSIEDMGSRVLGIEPPPLGSRFCINEIPPGNTRFMHRTNTIDYVVVLDGEIDMEMDDTTVTLRTGDTLVQRGTNHAWLNRSTAPARLAIVLIDGQAPR